MPGPALTEGFGELQPGEMVVIALRDPSLGPIAGQVLAVDDDKITILEPAEDRFESSHLEKIPTDAVASITRLGSAPLSATVADKLAGDSEDSGQSMLRRQWSFGALLAAIVLTLVVVGVLAVGYVSCCVALP